MTHDPTQPDFEHEPTLPGSLATLLRTHAGADRPLDKGEDGVETRIDDAVMARARETLGRIDPPKTLRFPVVAKVIGGLSVAAAAVGLVVWFGPGPASQTAPAPSAPMNDLTALGDQAEDEMFAFSRQITEQSEAADDDALMGLEMRSLMDAAPEPMAAMGGRARRAGAISGPNDVTIRDAYLLALAIDAGDDLDDDLDANADGVVDARDVETLASRAVALGDRLGYAPAPWYTPTLGALWPMAPAHPDRSVTR